MNHKLSRIDQAFANSFFSGELKPGDFHHKEHIHLAYIHLTKHPLNDAYHHIKKSLRTYLMQHVGEASNYHETLTYAWILAVHHFMKESNTTRGFNHFIQQHPILLDKEIIYSHYSKPLIESDIARFAFLEPDLNPIPIYH